MRRSQKQKDIKVGLVSSFVKWTTSGFTTCSLSRCFPASDVLLKPSKEEPGTAGRNLGLSILGKRPPTSETETQHEKGQNKVLVGVRTVSLSGCWEQEQHFEDFVEGNDADPGLLGCRVSRRPSKQAQSQGCLLLSYPHHKKSDKTSAKFYSPAVCLTPSVLFASFILTIQ